MKKLLLKFSQYPQETPVLESLFRPATLLKRSPNTGVFRYPDNCPEENCTLVRVGGFSQGQG